MCSGLAPQSIEPEHRRVSHDCRQINSGLMAMKNVSTAALNRQYSTSNERGPIWELTALEIVDHVPHLDCGS